MTYIKASTAILMTKSTLLPSNYLIRQLLVFTPVEETKLVRPGQEKYSHYHCTSPLSFEAVYFSYQYLNSYFS